MGLRRDKSPRLGDSLRRDGIVSEYPSPGSGATLAAADDRINDLTS
jgi:hypothetical protein